ncbi:MAG: hypothetical protein C0594_05600 [Marinilabiliales bacterium]|nr:MAG: hypothetical protein C0594_05600 [Marinilabiliales bacterium]
MKIHKSNDDHKEFVQNKYDALKQGIKNINDYQAVLNGLYDMQQKDFFEAIQSNYQDHKNELKLYFRDLVEKVEYNKCLISEFKASQIDFSTELQDTQASILAVQTNLLNILRLTIYRPIGSSVIHVAKIRSSVSANFLKQVGQHFMANKQNCTRTEYYVNGNIYYLTDSPDLVDAVSRQKWHKFSTITDAINYIVSQEKNNINLTCKQRKEVDERQQELAQVTN